MQNNPITISGTVKSIVFQNAINNFYIVRLETVNSNKQTVIISAKGVMPGIGVGRKYDFTGTLETNKYGNTIKVTSMIERRPSDIEGIYKYLSSGLIKKIGPVIARSIVDTFGEDTLDILDNEPERLTEVPNIGKKRLDNIIKAVKSQRSIRAIMVWLKRNDLSNNLATKIYKTWGDNSIAQLEENPYRLADDIKGIGFKKADEVALKVGLPKDSDFRIASAIHAALEDAANNGHTYMEKDALLNLVMSDKYIDLDDEEKVESTLNNHMLTNVIITEEEQVALPKYYHAETKIAERLYEINKRAIRTPDANPGENQLYQLTGMHYSDEQIEAIRKAMTQGFTILTGGPGTGKTAVTNGIIRALENQGYNILLAAPTGRAAKRVTEVSGRECKTIHRLLEFCQDGFQRNADNPLRGDVLIVDESSMIDTLLMKSLVQAVPNKMKVILVGDPDQLPSVGAGNVLNDLITYFKPNVAALTRIYRQAEGSEIVMAAHNVNRGFMPTLRAPKDSKEFAFINYEETEDIANEIIEKAVYCTKRNVDFQVLSPMKRDWDPIGTIQLNNKLQETINPDGKVLARFINKEYRIGDKVMQMKNNYDKGVFNGDIGRVCPPDYSNEEDIDEDNPPILSIDFEGETGKVNYTSSDINEIDLAYATTVHKSQGSEYQVVLMPIHKNQFVLLKRNLLYTAITRAKKYFLLIGHPDAVRMAVRQVDSSKRNTLLVQTLQEAFSQNNTNKKTKNSSTASEMYAKYKSIEANQQSIKRKP